MDGSRLSQRKSSAKVLFVPSLKRDIVPSIGMHTTSGGRGRMAIHIRRREFIFTLGGAAAAWPLRASAQYKPARIALLGSGRAQSSGIFVDALKRGLADNGLIEGQGYWLDIRWAEGEYGRFPALAVEAAKQNPSVFSRPRSPRCARLSARVRRSRSS